MTTTTPKPARDRNLTATADGAIEHAGQPSGDGAFQGEAERSMLDASERWD